MIILITASLSSKIFNKASFREECTFEGTKSTLSKSSMIPWDFSRFWSVWGTGTNFTLVRTQVSPFFITLIRVSKNCDDQIAWIKRGDTVQPQSCIQGNDFWFGWTVRKWSLFLTHPTDRNRCRTSQNAQCSTWCRFWIFKIYCKIEVLKQSQSALVWQYYPHDNIVCVHTYDE